MLLPVKLVSQQDSSYTVTLCLSSQLEWQACVTPSDWWSSFCATGQLTCEWPRKLWGNLFYSWEELENNNIIFIPYLTGVAYSSTSTSAKNCFPKEKFWCYEANSTGYTVKNIYPKMGLNLRKHIKHFQIDTVKAENKIILHLCTNLAYIGITKCVKMWLFGYWSHI